MINTIMAVMACSRMWCCVLLQLVFVFCGTVSSHEYVPVLMWDTQGSTPAENLALPPLFKLSSDEFSDFITKKNSHRNEMKPVIAVFVEENLSVEDFSWQDSEEHATFPHLENLTNLASHVDYFPAVRNPLKGLKRLGYKWQTFDVNGTGNEINDAGDTGIIVLIKLGDAMYDEDRPDFLKRHDRIISDIYSNLVSKYGKVLAMYTSHHSSWVGPDNEPLVRRIRSVSSTADDVCALSPTCWHNENYDVIVYSPLPAVFVSAEEPKGLNMTNATCTTDYRPKSSTLSLECYLNNREYRFELMFMSVNKYWYFTGIVYDDGNHVNNTFLTPTTSIYAPTGFSYHCTQKVVFKNGSHSLTIKNMQVQPFLKKAQFGDAYDCVWFFTAPIWSGLFVTAILAFILIWGLTMIMDIKTMDQFDDPKGKTITINVSE